MQGGGDGEGFRFYPLAASPTAAACESPTSSTTAPGTIRPEYRTQCGLSPVGGAVLGRASLRLWRRRRPDVGSDLARAHGTDKGDDGARARVRVGGARVPR